MSLSIGYYGYFCRGLRLVKGHLCMWDEDSSQGVHPSGNWRLGLTSNSSLTEANRQATPGPFYICKYCFDHLINLHQTLNAYCKRIWFKVLTTNLCT